MIKIRRGPVRRYSAMLGLVVALASASAVGVIAPSAASASGHCEARWDMCAWANAEYKGGGYGWAGEAGHYVHSLTTYASVEGCTTGSFNDCISSIDNNGPYTGYYYKNAACGGERYTNEAYTGTGYVGSFWNDTFSSLSVYDIYTSC